MNKNTAAHARQPHVQKCAGDEGSNAAQASPPANLDLTCVDGWISQNSPTYNRNPLQSAFNAGNSSTVLVMSEQTRNLLGALFLVWCDQ